MTRIIGGTAGGRRIAAPRGAATRPTTDRVREALFSAIESWCGSLAGLRFLDLYAGSGAVGLEAWSRGAGVVSLVEHDRRIAGLIGANAASLGFHNVDVRAATVSSTLHRSPTAPYDVAYLDPPYAVAGPAVVADLEALRRNGWLVPGALVVVERPKRGDDLAWPPGYLPTKGKAYGDSALWFAHAAAAEVDD